jgi:hypothetical protein
MIAAQLSAYLMVFLEHLDDCAKEPNSTHGRSDHLPHTLFFFNSKEELQPSKIWDRYAAPVLVACRSRSDSRQAYI